MLPSLTSTARRLAALLRARLAASRGNEDGYTTESIIVTALLVAIAIAALAIISNVVMDWASSISRSGGGGT